VFGWGGSLAGLLGLVGWSLVWVCLDGRAFSVCFGFIVGCGSFPFGLVAPFFLWGFFFLVVVLGCGGFYLSGLGGGDGGFFFFCVFFIFCGLGGGGCVSCVGGVFFFGVGGFFLWGFCCFLGVPCGVSGFVGVFSLF